MSFLYTIYGEATVEIVVFDTFPSPSVHSQLKVQETLMGCVMCDVHVWCVRVCHI